MEFGPGKGIGQSAEGSGWKTRHHIPPPSRWPWPQVPHLPNDNVPLRHVPHQGWSMEATWKLKSSVPKSDPSFATSCVIVGKTYFNSAFPLGNEGIEFPWLPNSFIYRYVGQGPITTFLFFAAEPEFPLLLCSRSILQWLVGSPDNEEEAKGFLPIPIIF